MENTIEVPAKTPGQAVDRAEFRRIRQGEQIPVPATVTKPPTQPSDTGSESAAPSEGAETKNTQEGKKEEAPKKDRSLEGRLRELRAAGKHDEADKIARDAWTKSEKDRADRLEQELRELRTRKPEPSPQPVPEPAKPPADPAKPDDSDKPKLKSFIDQAKTGETYEQVYEQWEEAVAEWRDKKRQAQTAQNTVKERVKARYQEALAKMPDLPQAAERVTLSPQVTHALLTEIDGGFEAIHHLGTHPDELARIQGLSPVGQFAETAYLARMLKAGAAPESTTEKPKPPVSKAAPPPPRVGGSEAAAPKNPSEARNREEYKKLRADQRKR